MSSKKIVRNGNGKGHRTPSLRELKVKRLVCFWGAQWNELKKLANSKKQPVRKCRRNIRKAPKENIDFNILLPNVPVEEPARNIWELSSDEEHRWGDLNKEEELEVTSLLKGIEHLFKDF